MLPFAYRQIHDTIELNTILWDRRIHVIVLPAVQGLARIQNRAGSDIRRDYTWREVCGGIQDAVAEGIPSHTEGAGVHVIDLVGDSMSEWPLIVELQRAIVRPAGFHR